MKTKKSREDRECYLCKGSIFKGEQYALKSIRMGMTAIGNGCPVEDLPPSAWEPYRVKVPVCDPCANPTGGQ